MLKVNIDGVDLAYTDSGGSEPAVIFSHGFGMDHTMFDPQVGAVSANHRVITWDQRGWGSTVANGPFDLWDSARDLLALLEHLHVKTAVLVGMSQGGFVSIRAALLAPDRVNGLVLIGSQAGVEARKESDEMIATWIKYGAERVHDALARAILGPGEWPQWFAKWNATDTQQLQWAYSCMIGREDVTARLREIVFPALVIHGTNDQSIALEKAQIMKRELGGPTTLMIVEGGTHAVNLSHSSAVNKALLKFLNEIDS